MTTQTSLISQRLAALGLAKPSSALLDAIEEQLTPRVAALVERSLTRAFVARAFASTLVEAPSLGSPEGNAHGDPALASSPLATGASDPDKTMDVAGTTDAPNS